MPGPPPTPLKLRLLRGNPGKRPLRPEPEPRQTALVPDPPPPLTRHAKAEWLRQAPELHALGLLTILDLQTFAAYCQAYGRWRDAEETLATMAERDDDARGLLVRNGKGDVRTNPLVRIAGQAAEEMVRFAGEFGMTPAARSKLVAGIGRQPRGKFDGLIG